MDGFYSEEVEEVHVPQHKFKKSLVKKPTKNKTTYMTNVGSMSSRSTGNTKPLNSYFSKTDQVDAVQSTAFIHRPLDMSRHSKLAYTQDPPPLESHRPDGEAIKTWHYPCSEEFPIRQYQHNIISTALFANTLVVLPTGMCIRERESRWLTFGCSFVSILHLLNPTHVHTHTHCL